MKELPKIECLKAIFEGNQRFLIISHANPDGDAIGSTIAMGAVLASLGKTVFMRNQDGVPRSLDFLKNADEVLTPESAPLDVDVVIALDCANQERLGADAIALGVNAKMWLNIDHHKTNTEYGDVVYVDSSAPATGQILFQIFEELGYSIPEAARDAIYVAVSTDTGSFRYRGTSGDTYRMAAKLVDQGLEVGQINSDTYERSPLRRVKLLGELLATMQISECGKVADWRLDQSVKDELGLLPDDPEDMINHMRAIEGVIVAVSFEDVADGKVRVSLRSKSTEIDVSEIAKQFGGGGHSMASGIRMQGPISIARERLIAVVLETLNQ